MTLQLHPYSVALGASAIVDAFVARVAWRRREASPASNALVALMVGLSIWSGTYAIGWATTSLGAQRLFLDLTYIGVGIVPAAFFVFTLRMTGSDRFRARAFAPGPLLVLAAVFLNPGHLYYPRMALVHANGHLELAWARGPLFWVGTGYAYALMIAGTVVLCRGLAETEGAYRRQRVAVLAGAAIPWLANLATESGVWRLGNLDTTPVAFTATGALIAWALFRAKLLDLLPIARSAVFDMMADGVLVIDGQGRLVDINAAAERMVRSIWPDLTGPLVGRKATDLWSTWPEVITPTERVLYRRVGPGEGRDLEMVVSRLDGRDAMVLVARDVTDRNRTQRELEEANVTLRSKLIEIQHLQARLKEEATHDPLTDLFNRRYFDRALDRELQMAQRSHEPVSVVILDVDHFKDLNDKWGHSTGDQVLRDIADMLRATTRATDTACRWGGEEFMVILPGADTDKAAERAGEWIRAASSVVACTLSAGISTYPKDGLSPADLVAQADRAMYVAKQSGRARVVPASA